MRYVMTCRSTWWGRTPSCRAAGLGKGSLFAPKPELAAGMIDWFLDAGHRAGWVTGDASTAAT